MTIDVPLEVSCCTLCTSFLFLFHSNLSFKSRLFYFLFHTTTEYFRHADIVTSSNSALAYKFHCSVNSLLYVNSEPNKTSMLSALLC